MSLTTGSGNITRAEPAFIRKDLFPLLHNFLVAPALFAAVPIEFAMSTWSLLICLMEAVKALNSSAFNQTHSRSLDHGFSKKSLFRKQVKENAAFGVFGSSFLIQQLKSLDASC